MIFETRLTSVDAEPVLLAGSNLMVVAVNGAAHIVPAEIFQLFFHTVPVSVSVPVLADTPAIQQPKSRARGEKPIPRPRRKADPAPAAKSELSTGEAVLIAVREGSHTQTTAIDRACVILGWDAADKKLRERVYQCIWLKLKNGELVKRDDPNTQLPILHMAGGGK